MIHADGLVKEYAGGHRAVRGISFDVPQGRILGFLGENGAGKSTTLRMLTGYLPPTAGTATLDGYDVVTDSMEVRRRIGYLPESVPLYPEMRVEEYLRYRAALKGVAPRLRSARVERVVAACGLGDARRKLIGQLSKGFRQRVGLADALVHEPPILILDEPTAGLDPSQIREVRELIAHLGRERTVLLSTHILQEVEMVCDSVVIIHQGEVVAEGSPAELRSRWSGAQVVRLLARGAPSEVEAALALVERVTRIDLREVDGLVEATVHAAPGHDVREELFRAVVTAKLSMVELGQLRASLEDVFVGLMGHAS